MAVLMSLGAFPQAMVSPRQPAQPMMLSFSFQPNPVSPQGTVPQSLETPGKRRVIRVCLDGVRMNRPVSRQRLGEHKTRAI